MTAPPANDAGARSHYDAAIAEQLQHYSELRHAALRLLYLEAKLCAEAGGRPLAEVQKRSRDVQHAMTRCRERLDQLERARLIEIATRTCDQVLARTTRHQPATGAAMEAKLLQEAHAEVEQLLGCGAARP